jgi:hypothetical protein
MDQKRYKIFPQANNVGLILTALEVINKNKDITKEHMASELSIVTRQVDYYWNVLYYFDLISSNNELTLKGRFINDPVIDRFNKLTILKNIIVENPIFREIDLLIKENKGLPSIDVIASLISEHYLYSESTLRRRANTARSWFDYFIKNEVYGDIGK